MLQNAVDSTVNNLFERFDADNNGYLNSKEIDNFVGSVLK